MSGREREKERDRKRDRKSFNKNIAYYMNISLCVCNVPESKVLVI